VSRQVCAACLAALVLLSAGPAQATGPTDTLRDFFARVNDLIQAPQDQMTIVERLGVIHRMTPQVLNVRLAAASCRSTIECRVRTARGGWSTR